MVKTNRTNRKSRRAAVAYLASLWFTDYALPEAADGR
jgi:hypothetical protein